MNRKSILMTIGYEGLKLQDFLEKLKENNVSFLVDVRQNPNSRKQGFSKSQLKIFLHDNKIDYIHFQKLGTPLELRQHLKQEQNYIAFFDEYKKYLIKQKEYLYLLKKMAEKLTCCLMCFEKNYQECHRQVISSTIEEISSKKLKVKHIR